MISLKDLENKRKEFGTSRFTKVRKEFYIFIKTISTVKYAKITYYKDRWLDNAIYMSINLYDKKKELIGGRVTYYNHEKFLRFSGTRIAYITNEGFIILNYPNCVARRMKSKF